MESSIGNIDEEGLINSLDKDGMSYIRAIFELIGNSIDGGSKNVKITIEDNYTLFIDNGKGMTRKNLADAFSLYKSNHSNDKSIGVSGYGLKSASKKLSNNSICIVYTHSREDNYLKVVIDWEKIITEKKYTGNIDIISMNENEIDMFNKNNSKSIGTIIEIANHEELTSTIKQQFIDTERQELPPTERIDFIFGNFENKIDIECYDKINNQNYKIDFYNIHNLNTSEYINVNANQTISVFLFENKDTNEWIFASPIEKEIEKYYYFKHSDTNCKTQPKKDKIPNNFIEIFEFKQKISFLKPDVKLKNDLLYFDLKKPIIPKTTGLGCINSYDLNFYGNELKHTSYKNNKMILTRNNSRIGNLKLGSEAKACGGKSAKEKHSKIHTHTELYYSTESTQKNQIDEYTQIQKNKHQYTPDEDKMKALIRMCEFNRNNFSEKIWKWMEDKAQEIHKKASIENLKNEKEKKEIIERRTPQEEKRDKERIEKERIEKYKTKKDALIFIKEIMTKYKLKDINHKIKNLKDSENINIPELVQIVEIIEDKILN